MAITAYLNDDIDIWIRGINETAIVICLVVRCQWQWRSLSLISNYLRTDNRTDGSFGVVKRRRFFIELCGPRRWGRAGELFKVS
jgi:hypothetical protein